MVAGEDLSAVVAAEDALYAADYDLSRIDMFADKLLQPEHRRVRESALLVSICSGKRNIVTRAVLSSDGVPASFIELEDDGACVRCAMLFDRTRVESASHGQQLELIAVEKDPSEGPLDNVAVLAKSQPVEPQGQRRGAGRHPDVRHLGRR